MKGLIQSPVPATACEFDSHLGHSVVSTDEEGRSGGPHRDTPSSPDVRTPEAMERSSGLSPRAKGRLAGLFEALEGLTSAGGQVVVRGKFVVSGAAAATAANIIAQPRLVWLGFALSVLGVLFHLAWALAFYELFKPVRRSVNRLALSVIITGCAVQAVTALLYIAPLLVLQNGGSLSGFTPEQQQALAYVFVKLNGAAFNLYLVVFGVWCVLIGYLIFKSTFLPRILGVLLAIDGLAWMLYLHPPLATQLFSWIAVASAVAEIPLQLWLLVLGVNPDRWKEQAMAGRSPQP